MTVQRHDDGEQFWNTAKALFLQDPVRHTVAITVINQLIEVPDSYGNSLMLTAHDAERSLLGAMFCTAPWPLSVSALPVETHVEVVDYLLTEGIDVMGVGGPRDVADPFMRTWIAASGQTIEQSIPMRLYHLGELDMPTNVAGEFRLTGEADVPMVGRWWEDFFAEATHGGNPESGEHDVRKALEFGRGIGLWIDQGEPGSFAVASPPRAGMSRIGPVYTPADKRGRGYGAAVTAHVAQWAVDQGAEHVLLFTDLDNPTSNSIYQRIGFRPVFDAVEYVFADRHTLEA
ncbi:GNAT family N-acetyltransferase [Actinokineospora xionganensis]|uniref:GNAT family N-acetyltransferase n=1 Tax=Actinokineospora xionganensis TaxID=2684470 RepID=A0ABR7LFF1_9PSEU|nr:GNAT family N-acetyltransferase [Actinokineospora xionganensis]MBC6451454.1 GNAT family N-acetyltransferase [Actinokineospora xionganensis]